MRSLIYIIGLLGGFLGVTSAQPTKATGVPVLTTSRPTYYGAAVVNSVLSQQFTALGDRLKVPGKERVVFSGTLADGSGVSAATVTIENGSQASLVVAGDANKSKAFDGKASSGGASATSAKVLESLVDDLPDSLFAMLTQGTIPRLLGRGFRDNQGRSCDFYDVPFVSQVTTTRPPADKRFCFDTATHLLRFVQYHDGIGATAPLIEVEFNNWTQVSGQALPGQIIRRDNGALTFALNFQTSAVSAKVNDNTFKQ